MNIEKIARTVEQSVSGIRVKVLNRCYAELEELKVVFDCASPIPEFCKVTGLMEKARFHNTHAYVNDDGDFTMIFARATSFGVEILEREAKRSRDELINLILKPSPSDGDHWRELTAIAQTVAILGEGMKISKELEKAARKATGIGI